MISQLDLSDPADALGVLKQAFGAHPMFPTDTPSETVSAFLELIVEAFGSEQRSSLFGINSRGTLACVAFVVDPRDEPKGVALLRFLFRVIRLLGWKLSIGFARALSNRPSYDAPYLELLLLGTLPEHHGQGLGRAMMGHLYTVAEERGYAGLILDVATETPAEAFYLKEGFQKEGEVPIGDGLLCSMRRDNAAQP